MPEIVLSAFSRTPLYAYNNDGTLKWQVPAGNGNSSNAFLADLEGDGQKEIIYNSDLFTYFTCY